jgi:hypothetical protein
MDRDLGLFDSDTGESLTADVVRDIASCDGPIELRYCTAKRGRIVQVRRGGNGSVRIHYFFDEPGGQQMIRDDERRNGVSLETILANAPNVN